MVRKTRFQIARPDILSAFRDSGKDVYSYSDISEMLNKNRRFWRLPVSLSVESFIGLLEDSANMRRYRIEFPNKKYVKFVWGDVSVYVLALSLEKESYLTHYTALLCHELTDQIPKTVYVNHEQSEKRGGNASLSQEGINSAFSRRQRVTRNVAALPGHEKYRICMLNGKFTNRLGVIEMTTPELEPVTVTDVERTLIDVVVRPAYAGGINEVLGAYRKAADRVSINRLAAMLGKLKYTYPYHQAIGFFLEKSGVYKASQMQLLEKLGFRYDFYIGHEMKDVEYSEKWRVYYPRGF